MTARDRRALALLTELDALWGDSKTVVVPTRALRAVLALALAQRTNPAVARGRRKYDEMVAGILGKPKRKAGRR